MPLFDQIKLLIFDLDGTLINSKPDIAVVFLDIVMETSQTGLDIIQFIREGQGNSIIQIVLQTGQTGIPPEYELITQYSVNEFISKVDLSSKKLLNLIPAKLQKFLSLLILERSFFGRVCYCSWTVGGM